MCIYFYSLVCHNILDLEDEATWRGCHGIYRLIPPHSLVMMTLDDSHPSETTFTLVCL
jgi:hypothetical protein